MRCRISHLEEPAHAALGAACEAEAVVLTPHPRAHPLYADKRNLVTPSDETALVELGVPAETRAIHAAGIPHTKAVTPERAEARWSGRRKFFFNPDSALEDSRRRTGRINGS